MSNKMPERDTTGKCEGECADIVNKGNKDRQGKLENEGVKSPESYPGVSGAETLNNPDNPAAGIPGGSK